MTSRFWTPAICTLAVFLSVSGYAIDNVVPLGRPAPLLPHTAHHGPILQSCNLKPPHGVPKTNSPPYTITLSADKIQAGETIEITVEGKTADDTIKGFIMVARNENDLGETGHDIGHFEASENPETRVIDCSPEANALVPKYHFYRNPIQSFKAKWTAPSDLTGNSVKILVTIAKEMTDFWVGVPSESITVG